MNLLWPVVTIDPEDAETAWALLGWARVAHARHVEEMEGRAFFNRWARELVARKPVSVKRKPKVVKRRRAA